MKRISFRITDATWLAILMKEKGKSKELLRFVAGLWNPPPPLSALFSSGLSWEARITVLRDCQVLPIAIMDPNSTLMQSKWSVRRRLICWGTFLVLASGRFSGHLVTPLHTPRWRGAVMRPAESNLSDYMLHACVFKEFQLCFKLIEMERRCNLRRGKKQQVAGWSRPASGILYMKVHFPSCSVVWQVHRPDNSASGRLCGELKYYQSSYCTLSKTPISLFSISNSCPQSGFFLTVKFKLLLLLYREY